MKVASWRHTKGTADDAQRTSASLTVAARLDIVVSDSFDNRHVRSYTAHKVFTRLLSQILRANFCWDRQRCVSIACLFEAVLIEAGQ